MSKQKVNTAFKEGYNMGHRHGIKDVVKLIDDVLRNRRIRVNEAFEGKDERMMAHLHTFINKFEEELKSMIKEKCQVITQPKP